MKKSIIILTFAIAFVAGFQSKADVNHYSEDWNSITQHKTPDWFKDGKFGIYFHWGIYSYIGNGEWYSHYMYQKDNKIRKYHIEKYGADFQYHEFIPFYTAKYFDADDWADLFKKSGAKFAGPVAEHCDNFSNWDSKVNPYNTVNMGPKRDIVGELEKSIKKQGLKFITTFHHSWEWGWYPLWNGLIDTKKDPAFEKFYGEKTLPEAFNYFIQGVRESGYYTGEMTPKYCPSKSFVKLWKDKIFEVVDKYQPDYLWFDSRVFLIPEDTRKEVAAHFYNKGLEWGKDVVMSYKHRDFPKGAGVVDTERGRRDSIIENPWITDDSWSWNSWGWNHDMRLKDANTVIDELIDIVSKNGCLLLNITPTCDGKIPEEMRHGLLEVGKWLSSNGEAIYKTRPFVTFGEGITILKKSPFGGVQGEGITFTSKDFRFTRNGNELYIIQLGVPESGEPNHLKSFAEGEIAGKIKVKSMKLLGSDEAISWSQSPDGLNFNSPLKSPNDYALVYKCLISD